MDEYFMDREALRNIASQFGVMSNTLKTIDQALEAAIRVLETAAFIGLIGAQAILCYVQRIQPIISRLSQRCSEIDADLRFSIQADLEGNRQIAGQFRSVS